MGWELGWFRMGKIKNGELPVGFPKPPESGKRVVVLWAIERVPLNWGPEIAVGLVKELAGFFRPHTPP